MWYWIAKKKSSKSPGEKKDSWKEYEAWKCDATEY